MVLYNPTGDSALYDRIEDITKQINHAYEDLIICEISDDSEAKKETIGNLKRLISIEKDLYKEAFNKKNRAFSFYTANSKIYELELGYANLYSQIVPSIYDMKRIGRRIMARTLYNYKMELVDINYAESKNKFDDVLSSAYDFAYTRNKISILLNEFTYQDFFNIMLYYLKDEIKKASNIDIEEELIKAKYSILMANPILEDRYINNNFELENEYHIGHTLLFELDNPEEEAISSFYKEHFSNAIKDVIPALLQMNNQQQTPGVKRFVVLYKQILKSILTTTNNECKNDIIRAYYNYMGENNSRRNQSLLETIISDSNNNKKVLKMSFKKENISN